VSAAVTDSAILIGEKGETTLACLPQSAGEARRIVAAHLERWGMDGLVDDAEVVVSVLGANAATHTGGTQLGLTVVLERDRTVRIAVRDCSRSRPHRDGQAVTELQLIAEQLARTASRLRLGEAL
jgi:hypothetical protein